MGSRITTWTVLCGMQDAAQGGSKAAVAAAEAAQGSAFAATSAALSRVATLRDTVASLQRSTQVGPHLQRAGREEGGGSMLVGQ